MKKSVALMLLMTMAMSFTFLFVGCEKSTYTDNQAYVVQDWIEVSSVSGSTNFSSAIYWFYGDSIEIPLSEYYTFLNGEQQCAGIYGPAAQPLNVLYFSKDKQETIDDANSKIGEYVVWYDSSAHHYKAQILGYKVRMVSVKLYANDYIEIKVVESYYGNIEKTGISEVVSYQGRNLGTGYIEYFI